MVDDAHFDRLVSEAFQSIPEQYREACEGLSIRVEARASEHVLNSLELDDPSQLLGLYHGVSLTRKSVFDVSQEPDEVILYRDPIVAYSRQQGLPLVEVVRHVLVHEIGHHFGYSDDDMERIEKDPQ